MKKKFIFAVLVILAFGLSIGCAMSSKEDYILSMKEVLSSKENIEFVSKSIESTFSRNVLFKINDNDEFKGYMTDPYNGKIIYHYPTNVYGLEPDIISENKFQYPNLPTTFIMQDIKNVYDYRGRCYKTNVNINGKVYLIKDENGLYPTLLDEEGNEIVSDNNWVASAKLWIYKDNGYAGIDRVGGVGIINFYKVSLDGKIKFIALGGYNYPALGFRMWIGDYLY